jgi:CubicO group peptidase (beta-lactamase class C family)
MEVEMNEYIQGRVEISPEEARFDRRKLDCLADQYMRLCEKGRIMGAGFLLARYGKIFAWQSIGRRSIESETDLLMPDSIKRIASITKVVTASAIMKLVESGTIWLEQPVKTIIPEFDTAMHGTITLWHLLTHTSGLRADGSYFLEPYPLNLWEQTRSPGWLTKAALAGPVQHSPGEQWNYCRVSGMHYNDFVEKEIFAAIGMNRSFLEVPKALWPEVVLSAEWDRRAMENAGARTGSPFGGNGVYSTPHDLFKLGQLFLNRGEYNGKRLLGKKTCEEMTRDQIGGLPSFHWGRCSRNYRQGLGWGFFCDGSMVGPATYNHEGWGWCALYVDPVEEFVYVAFIADSEEWDPEVIVKPRTTAFAGIL